MNDLARRTGPVSALAWVAILGIALLGFAPPSFAKGPAPVPEIGAERLPKQAMQTLGLIAQGGPFPYERDGARFGNREGLLPEKPRDYYREYTVRTPGKRNRGARRIVCGGAPRSPDVCYYTDDHYRSFARIRP